MTLRPWFKILLSCSCFVFGRLWGDEVRMFAAASLAESLQEIGAAFEKAEGVRVQLSLGGSNTLARQIREGAPADIFFSADMAKMDDLAASGLIVDGTRRSALSNTLVVVVNSDQGAKVSSVADLLGPTVVRLALAETQTVPAGIYAREYLVRRGHWEKLKSKVIATENVRAALLAVEAGNADAGIVFLTDALQSKRVRVAVAVPAEEGPEIRYPVALVKGARNERVALRFLQYLESQEAKAVFMRRGFLVL